MLVIWIVVFILLVVSSYTDVKYGIIYPSLYFCGTICCTAYSAIVLHGFNILDSVIASLFIGFVFLIGTKFGGGGGDVIMMASLAWMFGIKISLVICIFSFVEYFVGLIIISNQRQVSLRTLTLPFAPFVLSGSLTTFIIYFLVH